MDKITIAIDRDIALTDAKGEEIALLLQEIEWRNDEPRSCLMYGLITPQQWDRVWTQKLFYLNEATIRQTFVEFEESGLITLELALEKAVLKKLYEKDNEAPLEAFIEVIRGNTEASPEILSCSNWRACSVLQNIPVPDDPEATLQVGFQTIWAAEED